MARIVKKPDQLFTQIKPDAYAIRGSRVNAPANQPLPEKAMSPLYHGNRVIYTEFYNGTKAQAQKAANEKGAIYGTHSPEKIYPRWNSPRKVNPYPRSYKGKYGQVALPEQWKYVPTKNPNDAADQMLNESYDAYLMQNEPEDLENLENEWGWK